MIFFMLQWMFHIFELQLLLIPSVRSLQTDHVTWLARRCHFSLCAVRTASSSSNVTLEEEHFDWNLYGGKEGDNTLHPSEDFKALTKHLLYKLHNTH